MDFELASRTRRLFAAWIDGTFYLLFSKLGLLIIGIESKDILHLYLYSSKQLFLYSIWLLLFIFLFYVLVPTYIWSGQTIGKRLLSIMVVKATEDLVDLKTMSMRTIFAFGCQINLPILIQILGIMYLVDLLFIIRKDQKALHDLIAKTKVVYY
ncbi:RDD family protein [Gottfriedia sp. NPDC056225]|uniref:RDD family protein n=1 Tax=Gottfriedia sp. NPDC056225 TaxID=3345751 RepID=UPI001559E8F4|nr:RDD family protein [Arthrobacter citreus]